MNRTMILSVLGEYETGILGIFENDIENLRSLTMEIRNVISTQKYVSGYLKFQSSCPNTIEVLVSSFKIIKSVLDNNLKNRSDNLRIYIVRNSIIELFSNLEKIGFAIESDNNALLNKYNEIVIGLVSNCI
jgi:hypothetical protein